MTRAEFLSSKGYWLSTIQLDLYAQLEAYMKENNLNRTQLAEKLGVTKGYVSQLLNADFDHKISKLVDLALIMGKALKIDYEDISKLLIENEQENSDHIARNIFRSSDTAHYKYPITGFVVDSTESLSVSLSAA